MAAATTGANKRQERESRKALDEARKAGTAPAEVDEEGRDINPHIPQYIQNVPWYVDKSGAPSLKHQRTHASSTLPGGAAAEEEESGTKRRRVVVGQADRFRKGACSNCGAMTHQKKDCTERVRKMGAKWDASLISPDIVTTAPSSSAGDWASKHDSWAGYDAESHHRLLLEQHQIIESQKTAHSASTATTTCTSETDPISSASSASPSSTTLSTSTSPAVSGDTSASVGTLRDRNDLPKYLRNLDQDSAYFDPKTRSMRANPNPLEETNYFGDNWLKQTGEAKEFSLLQAHLALHQDPSDGRSALPVEALPTARDLAFKQFLKERETQQAAQQHSLEELYCSTEVTDLSSSGPRAAED